MTTTALKTCLIMLLLANAAFAQRFITLDTDTQEFLEDVNYRLYKSGKIIKEGVTLNNAPTTIAEKDFDSISLSRIDYEALGFYRENLPEAVLLTKKIIHLDEVIINSARGKEIILGETNRIVKSKSRPLFAEIDYGIMFINNHQQKLQLKKVVFYFGKISYKTAYRIILYDASSSNIGGGRGFLELGNPVYTSGLLHLNRKDDKKTEISLSEDVYLEPGKSVFVQVELAGYYDAEGKEIRPDNNDVTKLAFQLSNEVNYYSRMADYHTGEPSLRLVNINAMVNYDFANQFFSAPHKSNLLAPAMVLHAVNAN